MPESQEDLEKPRLVVPNAADRWFTLANYDRFVFDDRLVALKGLTMRGAMRDAVKEARKRRKARRNREAVGEQSRESIWQRGRTRTERRVAATRTSAASLSSSESSDRNVIQLVAARLRLSSNATSAGFHP